MLAKDTDKQEIVALYNTDPVFKALVGQLVRLQRSNPEKVSTLQGVISNYLDEHRVVKSTVGWVLNSVKSFLVRSFLPESFTVAKVQAPLAILPPPPPPAPTKQLARDKEAIKAQAAKEKKLELARSALSLVMAREQVEDILAHGDKTEIKIVDKELEIMLPTELLSQSQILDRMVGAYKERLKAQKQKLKEDSILSVVTTLEKNKMIPALVKEDKPVELLLQEAIGKLKDRIKTLPEIKIVEETEEPREQLSDPMILAISDKAKALKEKHAERRKDKVVEVTESRPDALGFNELTDVLKELQNRVENSRNDPGHFTKANFTQVRAQMASGLKKFAEEVTEIDRKAKITKPETINSLCTKELAKVREAVAKFGAILIENKPAPVVAAVPEVVEQSVTPATEVAPEVPPAPAAQVVIPPAVQEGFFARLFGGKGNAPALAK